MAQAAQPPPAMAMPEDPAALLQQAKNALRVFYGGHYNREEFKAAEHWLEALQHYPQAWAVADALLSDEGSTPEVLFFAAKILQNKIYYDFRELDPRQIEPLKQQVVTHLAAWSGRQRRRAEAGGGGAGEDYGAFLNRLCVVLAALAVQTNWQGVLTEVVNLMTAHGVPQEHILHLLEELPTECHSEQVVIDGAAREAFRRQLMELRPHVLAYLAAVDAGAAAVGAGAGGGAGPAVLQRKLFRSMGRWVYYFRELPPSELVAAPKVLDDAFRAIAQGVQAAGGPGQGHSQQQQRVFEAAVDLVIDVFQAYDLSSRPDHGAAGGLGADGMALVQFMVPRALQLRPTYQAALERGDEETAKGVCMVFTEMAMAYLQLLMAREDYEQGELLALVLACSAHPSPEVNAYTLPFWYHLALAMESAKDRDPALRALKLQQFTPQLGQLVLVLVNLMRYPTGQEMEGALSWEEMEKDEKEERVDYRYKLGDAMNDVCQMLGPPLCLQAIAARLHEGMTALLSQQQQQPQPAPAGSHSWKDCEACLWALRSVAPHIPEDEAAVLPQIMQMILQLPKGLPAPLQETTNHIIGHCARWLRGHPQLLEPLYNHLLGGLTSPETAPSAARAVRDVCMACGQLMGEPALALYDQLLAASLLQGTVAFKDEMHVLEGLCAVVSALPLDQARAAEARMVAPVAEHLMALLAEARATAPTAGGETGAAAHTPAGASNGRSNGSGSSSSSKPQPSLPRRVEQCLDRLTTLLKYCEPRPLLRAARGGGEGSTAAASLSAAAAALAAGPSPAVESLQRLLPVLEAVYQTYKGKADVMEKLCRLLKHALRTGKAKAAPLLDPLCAFLLGCYSETHVSSFLYAASILAAEFGDARPAPRGLGPDRAAQYLPRLLRLLEELSRVTLQAVLTGADDFREHPDVVEEFYFLAARFLAICPEALLQHCRGGGQPGVGGGQGNALMDSILRYAIAGLVSAQQREAQRALLHFLETLLDAGLPPTDGASASPHQAELRAWVLETVLPQAEPLLTKLVVCLAGEAHRDLVEDDRDASCAGVLWRLGLLLPAQHFQAGLAFALTGSQAVAEPLATPQDRARAGEALCAASLGGARLVGDPQQYRALQEERRRFCGQAASFAWRCRENARRWRKKGLSS